MRNLPIKTLIVLCLSLLLSACVATYQAADGVSGYRDLQIDQTTYYVEYTESARVDWPELRSFVLRRCAELASQKGYKAFDVLEKDEKTVYLKSDVNEVTITSMGLLASDPPVTHTYKTDGRVEGKRITYKIRLVND